MKHISKHAKAPERNKTLTRSTEQPPTLTKPEPLPPNLIARLFRVLRQRYGTAFTSQFGVSEQNIIEARVTWGEQLAELTPDEIKFGLGIIGDRFPQFPPNVYQFRDLCRSYKPSNPAHRTLEQAPIKKASASTYEKYRDAFLNFTGAPE